MIPSAPTTKPSQMTNQLQQLEDLTCRAVSEIFQSMVTMDVISEPPSMDNSSAGEIVASVGFVGDVINGVVYLYTDVLFARRATGQMLGLTLEEVDNDEMVNDAIGELSNMIAGYVKARLSDSGGRSCLLTIPTIVRGRRLSVEGSASVLRKVMGFRHGDSHFLVELLLKETAGK